MLAVLVFLIILLLVLRPIAQSRRERNLAKKLKQTRSAAEAGIVMDSAIQANRQESEFFGWLRESYRFWLR
jgi:hypothetical protein